MFHIVKLSIVENYLILARSLWLTPQEEVCKRHRFKPEMSRMAYHVRTEWKLLEILYYREIRDYWQGWVSFTSFQLLLPLCVSLLSLSSSSHHSDYLPPSPPPPQKKKPREAIVFWGSVCIVVPGNCITGSWALKRDNHPTLCLTKSVLVFRHIIASIAVPSLHAVAKEELLTISLTSLILIHCNLFVPLLLFIAVAYTSL